MNSAMLLHLFSLMAIETAKIAAPALLASIVVGLLIGFFQALTQINEQTLAFLPKLVAIAVVLWFTLPWMSREMVTFTTRMFVMMGNASQ
jgi:flagellar biosynthetic protein FliQ